MLLLSFLLTPNLASAGTTLRYQGLHAATRSAGGLIPELQQANRADQDQMLCMALNIYHEIRGGSPRDQWAVAFVTLNRTKRSAFHANNVCSVVWAQSQFSWTKRSTGTLIPRDKATWAECQHKAAILFSGDKMKDPTNGSTHFNGSLRNWGRGLINRFRIGPHWFARLPGSN